MSKTLIVPVCLESVAKKLVDNKLIYYDLDYSMKQVIKIAAEQEVITIYESGCKINPHKHRCIYTGVTYCLPDDINIITEPSQDWWYIEGLELGKIKKYEGQYIINFPNGNYKYYQGLPIIPNDIDDYYFVGWAFEQCFNSISDIYRLPLMYYKHGLHETYVPDSIPTTATWAVFKKK